MFDKFIEKDRISFLDALIDEDINVHDLVMCRNDDDSFVSVGVVENYIFESLFYFDSGNYFPKLPKGLYEHQCIVSIQGTWSKLFDDVKEYYGTAKRFSEMTEEKQTAFKLRYC